MVVTDLGVAVVTGGSGLIGRAVCWALAEAGHSVVAVDRSAKSLAELADVVPAGLHTVQADVTDHAQTSEIWRSAEWAPDVRSLVCVAGGSTIPRAAAEDIDPAGFESVLALNLTAAWKWCAEATRFMRARGEGRMVTFSSASVLGGFPSGITAYIAAKAGIVGLTRSLSRELGEHNITVNCVSPGMVPDQHGVKTMTALGAEGQRSLARQYLELQTVPTPVEPGDVAAAVEYLLAPKARTITGQVLHVNGGCFFAG